ncbi:metallophosphoesterase [Spirochaeta lutea]|uniref:metallophosphoesterase n=1 Tax=Spirochaeta lutea TaxID=1480694 RepID=UPI00068CF334|nr:metallophosphoesterase [Spirochaeta lutea]
MQQAEALLYHEAEDYRPRDSRGESGGLVELDRELPTLIVPDIHGRYGLVLALLGLELDGRGPVLEQIHAGQLQLVCLGDYVHAEGRASRRWQLALDEFIGGFKRHANMDAEMRENLVTVAVLLTLKIAFPRSVHLLKGNHENILNENGRGNLPFGKYAYEGAMVLEWMQQFYAPEVLASFARVEHGYPLLARGRGFLISHAEPREFFSPREVIDYRDNHSLILGLTWTDNGRAREDSVSRMLEEYLPSDELPGWYFGGHRPVAEDFALRAGGRFVQFHNPGRRQIIRVHAGGVFDAHKDIITLDNQNEETAEG